MDARNQILKQIEEAKILLNAKFETSSRIIGIDPNVTPNTKQKYFVKLGTGGSAASSELLKYEYLGLKQLRQASLESNAQIAVPKPLFFGALGASNSFIVMEEISFGSQYRECELDLGSGMAKIHSWQDPSQKTFGFPLEGCCGALEQPNNSQGRDLTWVEFWAEYRLGFQLEMLRKRSPSDTEIQQLGAQLLKKFPDFFSALHVEDITKSLIHGDLWPGNHSISVRSLLPTEETKNNNNSGLTSKNCPVIYDPAVYYGHYEAEFGIMRMFGGISQDFWAGYQKVTKLNQDPGVDKRALLYELHHHLNHYNIFGSGYRSGALSLMKKLLH